MPDATPRILSELGKLGKEARDREAAVKAYMP